MLALLLVLGALVGSGAAFAFPEDPSLIRELLAASKGGVDHAYWFRRLFAWAPSEGEAACARNGTVLYSATGRCHWLFDQGPCAPTHWLTLQPRPGSGLRAECVPRPCAPGFAFLADERRCAPERGLCAVGGGAGSGAQSQAQQREFRYSLRGEGRCHCKGFRAQGPDGACHLLFARGPCPHGQVLYPRVDASLSTAVGQCSPGRCPSEGDVPARGRCASPAALDCALLATPLLEAAAGLDVPLCDDPIRNAIVVLSRPSRDACAVKDERGACARTVQRSPQPFDWGADSAEDDVAFPD